MKTKIVGVVSVKGGVGKTSVTSNLGAVLSERFGKSVCLVDGNFSAPNLGMHLGVVEPEHTIHDVLQGKKHIFAAVHDFEGRFHFVPASLTAKTVKSESFKNKVKAFRGEYDYVLVDASPSSEIHATIDASDALLVVLSPDFPTVSTTVSTIKKVEWSKKPIVGLVLNRVNKKRYELGVEEIENTLGYPVLGVLYEDKKMMKSLSKMRPFTVVYPRRRLTKQYLALAETLTGEPALRRGWF